MDILTRANELNEYRERLIEVYSRAESELLDFSKCSIPLSGFLLVAMLRRLWQIQAATSTLCCQQNHYSAKIIYRAFIEHYFKSQYVWMRLAEEKNDEIGKDYYVHAMACEAEEIAKWDRRAEEMAGSGKRTKRSPITKDKFRLKDIIAYIHRRIPAKDKDTLPLKILPVYSRLSSFVHCGVSADVDDLHSSLAGPEAYIDILETSFQMLASSFLFSFASFAHLYRHFKNEDNPRFAEYCQMLSNILYAAKSKE